MNYINKLVFIFILIFLDGFVLFAEITPPSQYPYNNRIKRSFIDFDKTIPNKPKLKDMDSTLVYTFTSLDSPLKLELDLDPSPPSCVDSYLSGIVQASFSVGNRPASQSTDNYNTIYEHGKHFIDQLVPSNSFFFDLKVDLGIHAECACGLITKDYTISLAIFSYANNVKNIKVVEDKLKCTCTCNPNALTTFYVSSIAMKTRNISNLNDQNIFLELNSDYEIKSKVVRSSNPTTPIIEIPWKSKSNSNIIGQQEYDLRNMNQTDFNDVAPNAKNLDLFKWQIHEDITCSDFTPYLYQVQILRLYNIYKDYENDPKKVYSILDWNKALTIEVKSDENVPFFKLKNYIVTEGSGFYVWRVRPIGNYYDGGMANPLNYGEWADYVQKDATGNTEISRISSYPNGKEINYPDGVDGAKIFTYYITIDESLNWIHSRVFTEGKNDQTQFHDVMQYYDNLLRPRQTQRRLPSQESIILQQSALDFQGRATLQSLPFAIKQLGLLGANNLPSSVNIPYAQSSLKYRKSVLSTLSGVSIYDNDDFDNSYGVPNSLTSGILNQYYNTNSFLGNGIPNNMNVPSAEGYPFTRTILSNDGLNRLVEQSLPGSTHRIFDQTISTNRNSGDVHTIRNYYTKASDLEMEALFGVEAPNTNSVSKEITIDPNNVISYTYKDVSGKVIATALRSDSPLSHQTALSTTEEQVFEKKISTIFNKKEKDQYSFTVNGNVVFPVSTSSDYIFSESLEPFSYKNNCSIQLDFNYSLAYDANYKLFDHLLGSEQVLSNNSFSKSASILVSPVSTFEHATPLINKTALTGEYRAYSNITFENPIIIKNQLLTTIDDHITSIIDPVTPIIKNLNNLLAYIQSTKQSLITTPVDFKNIMEVFGYTLLTSRGWISHTNSPLSLNSTSYTLDINNCLKFEFLNYNCEDCYVSDFLNHDFSKDLLLKLYEKYKDETIYYIDPTDYDIPDERSDEIYKSIKIEILDVNNLSVTEKKLLDVLFYQYSIRLNAKITPIVENNETVLHYIYPFHIYETFNSLVKNIYNSSTSSQEKARICNLVQEFIDNFTNIIRLSNETDVLKEKCKKSGVLIVENDINTLDLLLNKTHKAYQGMSNDYHQYMENANLYYMDPSVVNYDVAPVTEIPSGYSGDEFGKYDLTKYMKDECVDGSSVISNLKIHETRYLEILSKINCSHPEDRKEEILSSLNKKTVNSSNNDENEKNKFYNDQLDKLGLAGIGEDERNLLTNVLKDNNNFNDEKGKKNKCDLYDLINNQLALMCEAKKPMFITALRNFLHDKDCYVADEDPKEVVANYPTTSATKVVVSDLDNLVNLLIADCQRYVIIEKEQDPLTTVCTLKTISPTNLNIRKKYFDALAKNKVFTIERIDIPTKFLKGITLPTSFVQGDNCYFEANLNDNAFSLLKIKAKNDAIEITKNLNNEVRNIVLNLNISNQTSPYIRADNYNSIINDKLQVLLSTKYTYLENIVKHNADKISIGFNSKLFDYLDGLGCHFTYDTDGYANLNKNRSSNDITNYFVDEKWENYYHKHAEDVLYSPLGTIGHLVKKNEIPLHIFKLECYSPFKIHLKTANRAFLLLKDNEDYNYFYTFLSKNIFQKKIILKESLKLTYDNPVLKSFNNEDLFTNDINVSQSTEVLPIYFKLEQFSKDPLKQNMNTSFEFESILLRIKPNASFSCADFKFEDHTTTVNQYTSCNIVYKFSNPPAPVSEYVRNKALCAIDQLNDLQAQIISKVTQYKQMLTSDALGAADDYINNLDKKLTQSIEVTQNEKMQHFTLYYYDRAGNLVRTVPPKGVNIYTTTHTPDGDVNIYNDRTIFPAHKFVTFYKYNSKGQVIQSDSPDENQFNKFIYSRLGHLKFSQSAKQYPDKFSYIKYDRYMRVIENGQITATLLSNNPYIADPDAYVNTLLIQYLKSHVEERDYPISNSISSTSDFSFAISFFIKTDYSESQSIPNYYGLTPTRTYLKNKVNSRTRDEDGDMTTKGDQVKTYYSYDVQGNVNFVIQDLPATNSGATRLFAITDYEYDLISKKVKSVAYNYYQSDSHIQEYNYDEDNRLKKVRTSRYGYLWEEDSKYQYYPHGPLQRIDLGHDHLQGLDYTYTIQGWLKGINNITSSLDPGSDGTAITGNDFRTAPDAYSQVLNYFNGDFLSYGDRFNNANRLNDSNNSSNISFNIPLQSPNPSAFTNLFNGNIASWEMNYTTSKTTNTQKLDYLFQYDYLNRLLKGVTFERTSPNHWNEINTFDTENSYDPNGNINTLKRYSNGNVMDNLFYNYNQIPPSNSPSNKLFQIHEGTTNANTTEDIKDQANPMNYDYDASGNLISDISEGISQIEWTVDGKVKNITYSNGKPEISYLYDASGNRIQKRVGIGTGDFEKTLIDYTIYARDANEQVMAIYERNITEAQDNQDPSISNCIKIRALMGQFDCEIEFTLCDNDYEIQSDGTLVSIVPVSAHCKNFPWVHVVTIPAGTKLLKYDSGKYDGKIPRKETGRGTYHSGAWGETYPDGFTRDGGISYLDIAGSNGPIPTTSVSTKSSVTPATQSLMPKLAEWHIYGNEQQGRFVTRKPESTLYYLENISNDVLAKNFFRTMDKKQYELKDHLGNVRATIGDYKIPFNDATSTRGVAPFFVDEKSVSDFYPGGMSISDRSWQGTNYRYGYNAQEKSLEIDASGNHHTAEFWEVNNSSLRRWNRDPKPVVGISEYSIFGNNPILFSDPNGDSIDLSKLYEKNKKGELVNRQQVQAFEAFAMTKDGQKWIKERAQKGFSLQGEIYKGLKINTTEEGILSKNGIDYQFNATNDNSYTYAIPVSDRLKINIYVNTVLNKFSNENEYFMQVYSSFGSLLHETLYHGNTFETNFLNKNYTKNDENKIIGYGQDHSHKNVFLQNNNLKWSIFGKIGLKLMNNFSLEYNLKIAIPLLIKRMSKGFHEYDSYEDFGKQINKNIK